MGGLPENELPQPLECNHVRCFRVPALGRLNVVGTKDLNDLSGRHVDGALAGQTAHEAPISSLDRPKQLGSLKSVARCRRT
jgi:hypothetical protein